MKRILMVMDTTAGGASHGSLRLFRALQNLGRFELSWIAAKGTRKADGVIADEWLSMRSQICYRAERVLFHHDRACRRAENRLYAQNILQHVKAVQPDLVLLQNIHAHCSFRLVERIPMHIPIVWTLRDMWALTGHCCYSFDCSKHESGCKGICPQEHQWGAVLGPPEQEWQRRESFFAANRDRIAMAAPSKWLAEIAGTRFKNTIRVDWITNTVELDRFRPIKDRCSVRVALGLPRDGLLLLAGAKSIRDERKGPRFLIEAFHNVRAKLGERVKLMLFGALGKEFEQPGVINVGSVQDCVFAPGGY